MTPREIKQRLREQALGTPTWGYADSGTRFHTLRRPWTPRTLDERLEDAAQVQRYTGVCPMVDLHTSWDASDDWAATRRHAEALGLRIGAVNPHLFAEDDYALGTVCHPAARVRDQALARLLEGVEIAKATGAGVLSLWFADGTNIPGQDSFRRRRDRLEAALAQVYAAMPAELRMVVEYKFFEPAFYHMDLPDWGSAYALCCRLGERARVLVDLGHHALGTNIEQIVALLLREDRLGGFHFNDKKYGDDDLTVGSIQPYQLFLIYCELVAAAQEPALAPRVGQVALMIDQNHNLQNQIEGTIQSVIALQTAYAKALHVDYAALSDAQKQADIVLAEECLKDAFATDVRPLLAGLRTETGREPEPLRAFRQSGYTARKAAERGRA
jgi:L-rhamnose isomerase / sugar isomerase